MYVQVTTKADAFRAGYGMGSDSVQLERRNRPFLVQGQALAEWLQTEAPSVGAEGIEAFERGYEEGAEAQQLEYRGRPFLLEDEALAAVMN